MKGERVSGCYKIPEREIGFANPNFLFRSMISATTLSIPTSQLTSNPPLSSENTRSSIVLFVQLSITIFLSHLLYLGDSICVSLSLSFSLSNTHIHIYSSHIHTHTGEESEQDVWQWASAVGHHRATLRCREEFGGNYSVLHDQKDRSRPLYLRCVCGAGV